MNLVPLPALADKHIWMLQDGPRAIVVDPGDAKPVFDALERGGLQLAGILVKHPLPAGRPNKLLLRSREATVIAAARAHAGSPAPTEEADVLAAPPQWKNDFR
jgi:hypothetical protein